MCGNAHLTPALSALKGGEGAHCAACPSERARPAHIVVVCRDRARPAARAFGFPADYIAALEAIARTSSAVRPASRSARIVSEGLLLAKRRPAASAISA